MSEEYKYRVRSQKRLAREKRRKKIIARAAVLAAFVVVLIVIVAFVLKSCAGDSEKKPDAGEHVAVEEIDGKIKADVYIGSIAVGGMDYENALSAIKAYEEGLLSKGLVVSVNEEPVSATLADIGLSCNIDELLKAAFDAGKGEVIDMTVAADEAMLAQFVGKKCAKYNVKPKNAGLVRENGSFVVKKSRVGRVIDEEATMQLIKDALPQVHTQDSISIAAVIVDKEPEYTEEVMAKCTDVLGKCSTTFKEYQTDRSANVRNATSFVNGTVLYPGEVLSVADSIYPLTADNGYKEAPSYAAGQVVDSLGGGVCQVSTTLYNAVLRAELKIVERFPHSMVVTYVEPSMDAAIAGDYKDLKFENDSETPIYIQGSAYNGVLTFTIYGHETRPSSRKVEFVSDIVETIEPGKDIVTKDPTKPKGYEEVTQEAHVGYVANLYKVIYENGVEVSREKVNYSKYKAEPKYVTKGTKKVKKDKDDKPNATMGPQTDDPGTTATAAPEPPVITEVPEAPTTAPEPTAAPADPAE
ncbi:MAG: hypothetical protein E7267_04745 [Lachnospiraceae bacterium]|nr:hypothetical protein [Lachnospiraceae bacterium]